MPADANAAWSSREHATALVCFGLFTGLIAVFLLRDASAFVSSQRDQLIGHVGASGGFTVAAAGTLLVLRRHRPHVLEIMAADHQRQQRRSAEIALRLVHIELPPVRALSTGPLVEGLQDNHQLLHGDFAPSNLLLDPEGRLWIYDFDDCGYGPVEFELGNALFMALFDTSPSLNQPSDEYRQFRHWFLGAYKASAEHPVSDMLIDIGLQARSDALRYWLSHLDEAPIGIRNATEAWHRHLRAFAGIIQP